jgi:hypothetical protein
MNRSNLPICHNRTCTDSGMDRTARNALRDRKCDGIDAT